MPELVLTQQQIFDKVAAHEMTAEQGAAALAALSAPPASPTGAAIIPAKIVPYLLAVIAVLGALIGLGVGDHPVLPALGPLEGYMQALAAVLGVLLGVTPGLRRAVPVLLLGGALLFGAPARAQITWAAGPSVPLMLVEPGAPHPVSIVPGAGLQLSFSDQRLTRAIGGKSWDMLDVTALAFGSLVKSDSGAQFGQLSAALAVCTMSSLVCLGGGKHLLTNDGIEPGGKGWFIVFALSFNLAIAPQSPPVGIPSSAGASGLVRANHLYLGGE